MFELVVPIAYSHSMLTSRKPLKSFEDWYSNQLVWQLNDNDDVSVTPVDLSLSKLKPLSARWLVKMHQYLGNHLDIIRSGFNEVGIVKALKTHMEDELPLSVLIWMILE